MSPGEVAQAVQWIFVALSFAFALSGIVLWRRSKPLKPFMEFMRFPALFCLLGFLSWVLPEEWVEKDRAIGAVFRFAPFLFFSIGCFLSGLNAHLDAMKK